VKKLMKEVCEGASNSLAFGARYAAVLKSIQRTLSNIKKSLERNPDSDIKALLLSDSKELQVMEAGIRLVRNVVGEDTQRKHPVDVLARRWRSLECFANSDPASAVRWSPWYNDKMLRLVITGQFDEQIGDAFSLSMLSSKLGKVDAKTQRSYFEQALEFYLQKPMGVVASVKD
jgi:hypothetical protein